MRALLLTILVAGCNLPYKYQTFDLGKDHRDVIWVFRSDTLYRCSNAQRRPVCVEAEYVTRADPEPPEQVEHSEKKTAPAPEPVAAPTPPAKKATPAPAIQPTSATSPERAPRAPVVAQPESGAYDWASGRIRDEMQRAIAGKQWLLSSCRKAHAPTVEEVPIKLVVDRDGDVSSLTVDTPSSGLSTCVGQIVKTLRTPTHPSADLPLDLSLSLK